MRYLDSVGVSAHVPVPVGGVVCIMKSAPVVRCVSLGLQWHSQGHTLEVWVALVGFLWILYELLLVVPAGLMRLLSGCLWSCWSYEISQWEPTCLCTYTCGDTLGLLLHFIPVFLYVLTAVLHKCIWCVVEAFRGNQT